MNCRLGLGVPTEWWPSGPLLKSFEAAGFVLAYAAEIGASHVVYHAHALPDSPANEDLLLAETRSLARFAARAERLG
ncbi:MAG TPA: hypothetical protein VHI76_05180 [Solirubrobacterales bacterium]|nr:hypothetical protein [Solirubrobacterales bacterium]